MRRDAYFQCKTYEIYITEENKGLEGKETIVIHILLVLNIHVYIGGSRLGDQDNHVNIV